MNEFHNLNATLIIKSGSKEKSINSYIQKVCKLLNENNNLEIRAHGKTFYYLGK